MNIQKRLAMHVDEQPEAYRRRQHYTNASRALHLCSSVRAAELLLMTVPCSVLRLRTPPCNAVRLRWDMERTRPGELSVCLGLGFKRNYLMRRPRPWRSRS